MTKFVVDGREFAEGGYTTGAGQPMPFLNKDYVIFTSAVERFRHILDSINDDVVE